MAYDDSSKFVIMQCRKWHNKKVFEEILKKDGQVQL